MHNTTIKCCTVHICGSAASSTHQKQQQQTHLHQQTHQLTRSRHTCTRHLPAPPSSWCSHGAAWCHQQAQMLHFNDLDMHCQVPITSQILTFPRCLKVQGLNKQGCHILSKTPQNCTEHHKKYVCEQKRKPTCPRWPNGHDGQSMTSTRDGWKRLSLKVEIQIERPPSQCEKIKGKGEKIKGKKGEKIKGKNEKIKGKK